jgi:hypothetical protein
MDFYTSEYDKTVENNKELYEEDWLAWAEHTGYILTDYEDLVSEFNANPLEMILPDFENAKTLFNDFKTFLNGGEGVTGLVNEINTKFDTFDDAVTEVL